MFLGTLPRNLVGSKQAERRPESDRQQGWDPRELRALCRAFLKYVSLNRVFNNSLVIEFGFFCGHNKTVEKDTNIKPETGGRKIRLNVFSTCDPYLELAKVCNQTFILFQHI